MSRLWCVPAILCGVSTIVNIEWAVNRMRKRKTNAWLAMLVLLVVLFAMSTALFGLQCYGIMLQLAKIMLEPECEYLQGRVLDAYDRVPAYYAENWIFSLEVCVFLNTSQLVNHIRRSDYE